MTATTIDGRYELVDPLGFGGMAVVWRARDLVLGRFVALKLLAGRHAGAPGARQRVRDEARAAAAVTHPNIAQVYDYGEWETEGRRLPYVVMELVRGSTLQQRMDAGPLTARYAMRVGAEVAAALAAAHAEGLVHRDIKPANVMVATQGAKVVDFGIAAAVREEGTADPEPDVYGTPGYLAPERLTGSSVEPASDVYALGVLLYRMLSGESPWAADSTTQMLQAHVHIDPVPLPARPGVPDYVTALCDRCLSKDPTLRPSAREAAALLAQGAGLRVVTDDMPAPETDGAAGEPSLLLRRSAIDQALTPDTDEVDNTGTPAGTVSGAAVAPAAGMGTGAVAGMGTGAVAGMGAAAGMGTGTGAGMGTAAGAAAGAGMGTAAGTGAAAGGGTGAAASGGGPRATSGAPGGGPSAAAGAADGGTSAAAGAASGSGTAAGASAAGPAGRGHRNRRRLWLVGAAVLVLVAGMLAVLVPWDRSDQGPASAVPRHSARPATSSAPPPAATTGPAAPSSPVARRNTSATTGPAIAPPVVPGQPTPAPGGAPVPTTTAPEPDVTTTTAPPPPPPPPAREERTFQSAGGTVRATCPESDVAELLSWTPQSPYKLDAVDPGPAAEASVSFKHGNRRVSMAVTCANGVPRQG